NLSYQAGQAKGQAQLLLKFSLSGGCRFSDLAIPKLDGLASLFGTLDSFHQIKQSESTKKNAEINSDILLLLRHHSLAQPHISRHLINRSPFQVNRSLRSITSSTIHSRASHMLPYERVTIRSFSTSELAVEHKDSRSNRCLTGIFSKPNRSSDETKLDLESNNVIVTHDLVIKALRSFNTAPDAA
ncbi:hypothetical protein HAX54_011168, partial [Datura stramonium]|nr:hypothetical protein [Datura stramonium]